MATQRLLLAEQLVHQRSVQPGPLVLRPALLKSPTPAVDRDRTVSRTYSLVSKGVDYTSILPEGLEGAGV